MIVNDVIGHAAEALKDIDAWDIHGAMHVSVKHDEGVRVVLMAARNGYLPKATHSTTALGAHTMVLTETLRREPEGSEPCQMQVGIAVDTLLIGPDTRCYSEEHEATYENATVTQIIKSWVDQVIDVEMTARTNEQEQEQLA